MLQDLCFEKNFEERAKEERLTERKKGRDKEEIERQKKGRERQTTERGERREN